MVHSLCDIFLCIIVYAESFRYYKADVFMVLFKHAFLLDCIWITVKKILVGILPFGLYSSLQDNKILSVICSDCWGKILERCISRAAVSLSNVFITQSDVFSFRRMIGINEQL